MTRRDFPEVFARMAAVERSIGATILRRKGVPLPLLDLPPDMGRYEAEPDIECGPACESAMSLVGTPTRGDTPTSTENEHG